MFRLAARSVKTPFSARLLSTSAIRPARKQFKAVTSTKAPYITITACALTSAGMYYYLMSKVKNEDEAKDDSEKNAITDVVVEVVDIIDQKTEEVVAEVVEVITNPSTEEEPVAQDAETAPADQSGAFNEETGEINWDCPCLGGMAHGPCGEDFKAAFSCFVYSKEEPKGIECIDKFKAMQDCFRRYPDVYSEELRDDDAEEAQHQQQEQINQEIRATEQAVMNNDIVESVEQAIEEVKEIEQNVKATAFNLYASAQKKIDDFNKK